MIIDIDIDIFGFIVNFNTRFALGAPVLYVELVYFLRGGNSSFRLYADYRTSPDASQRQMEHARIKFEQSPICNREFACSVSFHPSERVH